MIGRLAAALCAALFVIGCGGSGGGDGDESPGLTSSPAGEGSLIISYLNSIIERDLESGAERTLISTDVPSSFLLDAAPSPDGGRIAYISQPPAEIVDGRFDAGSDLWVMNRDGSEPRLVFAHIDPNQLVRFPRWQSAEHVLAIVTELSTVDGVTRVLYTLQRFDIATGVRERVLENVLSFDVSADGQRLVYSEFVGQTGEVLAASDQDGTDELVLVGQEQQLQPFGYPRFSPDGTLVAFASADQTAAPAPSGYRLVRLEAPGQKVGWSKTFVDGLPQDIWTVAEDGGTAVRVADLKEDLPSLTWDGSGDRIYALGVGGMYDINVKTGAVERIGEGIFHGQIAWAPSRD